MKKHLYECICFSATKSLWEMLNNLLIIKDIWSLLFPSVKHQPLLEFFLLRFYETLKQKPIIYYICVYTDTLMYSSICIYIYVYIQIYIYIHLYIYSFKLLLVLIMNKFCSKKLQVRYFIRKLKIETIVKSIFLIMC